MSAQEIYFDNSATTRQYDEVTEYMSELCRKTYGNPSSLHLKGIEAERIVVSTRETLAGTLSVSEKEIIFTSGGTESNNMAIRGYLSANPRKGRHIITTAVEHPSVLETFRHCQEIGYEVDYIGVDEKGFIRLEELESKIRQNTALISVIMVNNETGAIQPVDEIIKIKNAVNRNAVIHGDAVQSYGKLPINPGKTGIDMLSVSAHKIHGPKGMGILYAAKNVRLKPILFGGGQESLLRSGTENVPGIGGFGLAAEIKLKRLVTDAEKAAGVKAAFLKGLGGCSFDWRLLSPENSSPYIINVSFPGLRSEVLLHHLEERSIFVSSGSACSSHKKSKSHVLTAMGLSNEFIDSAIRFSLSGFNTVEEAELIVEALEAIVPKITVNKTGRRKI